MQRTLNPYAPDALNGLMDASPPGCLDIYHVYPFDATLAANQVLDGQIRSIDQDSDFLLRALTYASAINFSVRLADAQGFYLSDQKILDAALSPDGGRPWVFFPEIIYPAGGGIGIDLTETGGVGGALQLSFIGAKRYRNR